MLKLLLAGALVLALTGCATAGNSSLKGATDESVASAIVEGETTQAEVRENFGSPASTYFDGTGGEVWIYVLSSYKSDAKNFIPFMALVGTSASGTSTQLQVQFNDADVVERYSFNSSEMEYGTGVFQ